MTSKTTWIQNGISVSNQASKHNESNMSQEFLSMEPQKWCLLMDPLSQMELKVELSQALPCNCIPRPNAPYIANVWDEIA